jgi:hypothetical protein
MDTRHLKLTGPAADLESVYLINPEKPLPDPKGLVFNKQGVQIIPPQPHVAKAEVKQMEVATSSNPLPFSHGRFFGVPVADTSTVRQINQPGFLSVNEEIYR